MARDSQVTRIEWEGWSAVQVDVEGASLVVIPELGAKIVSLTREGDDANFIWRDETRPLRAMTYGDEFGNYDASGFDECFPTIGECPYPRAPWEGVTVPDHGELWTARWDVETDGRALTTVTDGVCLPYRFWRMIEAGDGPGAFRFVYRVHNLLGRSMETLWSAHPLLAARPGMQVLMPGNPRGSIVFAGGGRIAEAGDIVWPSVPTPDGGMTEYGAIGGPELHANDKVCVETTDEGWVALFDPGAGRFCALRVNRQDTAHIAVCINHGWWPFSGQAGYWVALEPCTGFPDRLDEAMAAGRGRYIGPGGWIEWKMDLVVGSASHADEVAERMKPAG